MYKIISKCGNWTIRKNLTERQVIDIWKSDFSGNISSLNYVIQDEKNNSYIPIDYGYGLNFLP